MERRRRIQFLPFHLYTRRTFNGNRWEIHKFIVTSPCRLTLREGKRKHYLVTVFQWDSFPVMLQKKRKKFSFKINFLFPFSFKITCFSYFTAFFLDLFCENFQFEYLKKCFYLEDNCFTSLFHFCCITMWISYVYTYISSLLSLPPTSPSHLYCWSCSSASRLSVSHCVHCLLNQW